MAKEYEVLEIVRMAQGDWRALSSDLKLGESCGSLNALLSEGWDLILMDTKYLTDEKISVKSHLLRKKIGAEKPTERGRI